MRDVLAYCHEGAVTVCGAAGGNFKLSCSADRTLLITRRAGRGGKELLNGGLGKLGSAIERPNAFLIHRGVSYASYIHHKLASPPQLCYMAAPPRFADTPLRLCRMVPHDSILWCQAFIYKVPQTSKHGKVSRPNDTEVQ